MVEISAVLASLSVAWTFGPTWQIPAALVFTWALLALAVIDIERQMLPDSITLPLLWVGLILSLLHVDGGALFTDLRSSVIGSAAGYFSLWSLSQLFKLATGREGMGHGDFKLLAAMGAWLGWQMLPFVILLSALVGTIIGITMMIVAGLWSGRLPKYHRSTSTTTTYQWCRTIIRHRAPSYVPLGIGRGST